MLAYTLLMDAALIATAGLILGFVGILYLVGSTSQLALKRWYKRWYRKRLIARHQRAYAKFRARYDC